MAMDFLVRKARIVSAASRSLVPSTMVHCDFVGRPKRVLSQVFEYIAFVYERRSPNKEAHMLVRSSLGDEVDRRVWLIT